MKNLLLAILTNRAVRPGFSICTALMAMHVSLSGSQSVLYPVGDAYVQGGENADSSYGSLEPSALLVKANSTDSYDRKGFLRFSFGGLEIAEVESATLRLYLVGNGVPATRSLYVKLCETNWDESTVTWNSMPATLAGTPVRSVNIAPASGVWVEVDVTPHVLFDQLAEEIAFLLDKTTYDSQIWRFSSKEGDFSPELVLEFPSATTNVPPSEADTTLNLGESDVAVTTGNMLGVAGSDGTLHLVSVSGESVASSGLILQGSYGLLTVQFNGAYSYQLDAPLESLSAGTSVNDAFSCIAADASGGEVAFDFIVNILGENDAPILLNDALTSLTATEDSVFSYSFDISAFTDVDATDSLALELAGALPEGFVFDSNTATLSSAGVPVTAVAANGSPYLLSLSASDGALSSSADSFELSVEERAIVNADNPITLTSSFAVLGSAIDLADSDLLISNMESDGGIRFNVGGTDALSISNSGEWTIEGAIRQSMELIRKVDDGLLVAPTSSNSETGSVHFALRSVINDFELPQSATVDGGRFGASGSVIVQNDSFLGTASAIIGLHGAVGASSYLSEQSGGVGPSGTIENAYALFLENVNEAPATNIIDHYGVYQKDDIAKNYFAGNVGIGAAASDPQNALDVDGTIRAKKIIVDADWADFVFEDDYQLLPIEEVERFIANYKRLPDVPSQGEVESEGVSLGESQSLLLRKVEELTLYLIRQKNEKDELAEQVKRQQSAIEELTRRIQAAEKGSLNEAE